MRLASAPFNVLNSTHLNEDAVGGADEYRPSSSRAQVHVVPSDHPHVPELEDADRQTMLASSHCFVQERGSTLILARTPPTTSSLLELRLFALPGDLATASRPRQLLFPAPLLGVRLTASADGLYLLLQACTITAHLFRIRLPIELLTSSATSDFLDNDDIPDRWVKVQRLSSAGHDVYSGSSPICLSHHSSDLGVHLATCSDGRILKAIWRGASTDDDVVDGAWYESTLRASSFFSGMSRLFSRSNVAASTGPTMDVRDGGSPAHALGIETFVRSSSSSEHTLGISTSRDRKIRLWDLSSDACVRVIDLPSNVAMTDATPDQSEDLVLVDDNGEARVPLPTTAKTIIKAYSNFENDASSSYPLYFVVFVPTSSLAGGFFALYGVQFDGNSRKGISSGSQTLLTGDVGDVDLLWQKECDIDTRGSHAELRDIVILPAKKENGIECTLWSLWDVQGKPVAKFTTLGEERDEALGWSTVSSPVFQVSLHGSEMDQDLGAYMQTTEQTSSDIAAFFLERILEAGRYAMTTLEGAITMYADDLEAQWPSNQQKPPALLVDAEFDSVAEQMASLVGCNVQLEADRSSGALDYEAFWGSLRREWSRFIGILDDLESKARWPIAFVDALATDEISRDSPFVVSPELLSIPIKEDSSAIIQRLCCTLAPTRMELSPALATTLTQASRTQLDRSRVMAQREVETLLETAKKSDDNPCFHSVENNGRFIKAILDVAVFAKELQNSIEPIASMNFEASLEEGLHLESSTPLETVLSEAWIQHVQAEWTAEEGGTMLSRFQELKYRIHSDGLDSNDLIMAFLDTLFEGFIGQDLAASMHDWHRTELGAAIASDAFIQLTACKLYLAQSLCYLVAAIASENLELTSVDLTEISTRTLTAWQRLRALHSLLSREGVPETAIEEPASEALLTGGAGAEIDADVVASRIDRLGFSESNPSSFVRDVGSGSGIRDNLEATDGTPLNPVHASLLAGHFGSLEGDSQGLVLSAAIPSFTSVLLGPDCLFDNATAPSGLSRAWAMLAHNLVAIGYPSAAASLLSHFLPSSASSYILGRCAMLLGDAFEASRHFDDVARALLGLDQGKSSLDENDAGDDEETILISLLPTSIRLALGTREALVLFYRHVALYMASLTAHDAVVKYSRLALDQHQRNQGSPAFYSSSLVRDLWFTLFRANLTLSDFEASYATVMAIPKTFHDLKRDSLRSLIGVMCESGQIAQLLDMNFADEQAEVERTLSFKARNSDPFTTKPNYYRILYSFYTKRGDLKSAGAVMYQQGTRLGDIRKLAAVARPRGARGGGGAQAYSLDREESVDLAILETNCYLAAVNVLALIEPRDAWFADALPRPSRSDEAEETEGDEDGQDRQAAGSSSLSIRVRNPKTGLTSYVPQSRFARDSHEISIVRLSDVRRLCRLCLARLALAPLFPEVAFSLDAMSAVLLFARVDEFDKALELARDMGLDESGVLVSLAERCIGLARLEEIRRQGIQPAEDDGQELESESDEDDELEAKFLDQSQWSAAWKGSASSRAWRYLRLQLDLSSSSDTSSTASDEGDKAAKVRLMVLEKVLSLNAWRLVPPWLVEWFRTKRPDILVRSLSSHDLVDAALDEALLMVQTSTDGEVSAIERKRAKTAAQSTWLPYLVIDALLVRAQDPSDKGAGASGSVERREKAESLKKAVRERLDKLKGLERVWRGEVEADEARARRFASSSVQRSSTAMEM